MSKLPSVKAEVPVVDVSAELNPDQEKVEIPSVKPERTVVTREQPAVVKTPNGETSNTSALADPVSTQNNEEGQDAVQVTGKVIEVTPESEVRPEQPVVPQPLPMEGTDLTQDSDVNAGLPDNELFLVDQITAKPLSLNKCRVTRKPI